MDELESKLSQYSSLKSYLKEQNEDDLADNELSEELSYIEKSTLLKSKGKKQSTTKEKNERNYYKFIKQEVMKGKT